MLRQLSINFSSALSRFDRFDRSAASMRNFTRESGERWWLMPPLLPSPLTLLTLKLRLLAPIGERCFLYIVCWK